MSDLYESDILTWSEEQAALLRRRATGELVNDTKLDWPNIAEEIEDVGKSAVRGVRSHLLMALLHDLKAEAWPLSRDAPHWRAEARLHRDQARDDYVASMAAKIDVAEAVYPPGAARYAGDDGRSRTAAGAGCLPGDAGRTARRGAAMSEVLDPDNCSSEHRGGPREPPRQRWPDCIVWRPNSAPA